MKGFKKIVGILLILAGVGGFISGIQKGEASSFLIGGLFAIVGMCVFGIRTGESKPKKHRDGKLMKTPEEDTFKGISLPDDSKPVRTMNTAAPQPAVPVFTNSSPVSQQPAASDDEMYMDVGIYQPTYVFSTVDGYKNRLTEIRDAEKMLVKEKKACSWPDSFTMNGSLAEGKKVVNDWMNLMLRAFNGESDVIIDHVTFLNYNRSMERIQKSAESINKIGARMKVMITQNYIDLKLRELAVAFDYQQFKEAEKERLRQIREEEREKAKVEKELADRRAKIEKDQNHVGTELDALRAKMEAAGEEEIDTIKERIAELEEYQKKLETDLQDVENRAQQARTGYVYIISNIGSFGENVYKIGMTRRLDPQDRVDELGSASVPFRFDVHAFIFSEDAVDLETALHHAFDKRRVNMVNQHKEFFRVTLDEIEECVKKNYSKTVEFTRTATAQEYRETQLILGRNAA